MFELLTNKTSREINMKKPILAISILAMSFQALAGYHANMFVGINTQYKYAWGSMASARYSSDTSQIIRCTATSGKDNKYGNCYARSESGTTAACTTYDSNIVDQIRSINSESVISFFWSSSGECLSVSSSSDSTYKL